MSRPRVVSIKKLPWFIHIFRMGNAIPLPSMIDYDCDSDYDHNEGNEYDLECPEMPNPLRYNDND